MNFFEKLNEQIVRKNSLLCVGLDPQDLTPAADPQAALLAYCRRIVEECADFTVCFKPNIAFFEAYGADGISALQKLISEIPQDIPVLLDAKRGDIGNTAKAYARAVFEYLGADAVTLNPFLGYESFVPFLEYQHKGIFALCRTSNPGAGAFQSLTVSGGDKYYLTIAQEIISWSPRIGLVVGGNLPDEMKEMRERFPETWILAPGIGTQGGNIAEALTSGMRRDRSGILLNVSRAVADAISPREAARKMNKEIACLRADVAGATAETTAMGFKRRLIRDLIETACFRLGSFQVKSGAISPFYIDLRMVISSPDLLGMVCRAFAQMASKIAYDRLAGIPVAGVPFASGLSLLVNKPMVLPRLTMKQHGTGKHVEGAFTQGEVILLVDDLITTGLSKLEAINVLKSEGLIVKDLLVLIERGEQGREDMERAGINLHSFLNLSDILDECQAMGKLDATKRVEIEEFLGKR